MSYKSSHVGRDVSDSYDSVMRSKFEWIVWREFVRPSLYAQLSTEKLRSNGCIVDFACGTGRVLELLSEVFEGGVIGIDISPDMISVARARVPEATFINTDVLEHCTDVSNIQIVTLFRFLLNAEPKLRKDIILWLGERMLKGGRLIGNTHMNPLSVNGIITVFARFLGKDVNYMSRQAVEALLEYGGFEVVEWKGFQILPTFRGRPILGWWLQEKLENFLIRTPLKIFGSEQIFVAKKID